MMISEHFLSKKSKSVNNSMFYDKDLKKSDRILREFQGTEIQLKIDGKNAFSKQKLPEADADHNISWVLEDRGLER